MYDKDTSIRPEYKSYRHALTSIYKQSNLRGLYNGVTPNIVGSTIAWGSYFLLYDKFKTYSPNSSAFFNGFLAGLLTQCITNPFWVVKTQCCLQYENKPKTVIQVTKEIFDKRGVQGFYRGFVPGMFNTVHGGVQMGVYEWIKQKNPLKNQISADLLNGGFSRVVTTCLLYPITTVKVRLQEQHRDSSKIREVVPRIYEQHGVSGFYRGLGIQLIQKNCRKMFIKVSFY